MAEPRGASGELRLAALALGAAVAATLLLAAPGLLFLAPALILLAPLLAHRYPGERQLARWAGRAPRRRPRAAPHAPCPRAPHLLRPRIGADLAAAIAGRAPPALLA